MASTQTDAHQKPRKADIAHERLRQMIVALEIQPGAAIDERELIASIGVGRTPLREAIQRLTHEGLITQQPRRGRWASPLSILDLHGMVEARRMIEPPVARLAAERITPGQVETIERDLAEAEHLVTQGDTRAVVFHDQRFHEALGNATGNRHLAWMVRQINEELLRYWYVSFVWVGDLAPTFAHHRTLLEAIAGHDGDRAERLMHEHLDLFRDRIAGMMFDPKRSDHLENGQAHR